MNEYVLSKLLNIENRKETIFFVFQNTSTTFNLFGEAVNNADTWEFIDWLRLQQIFKYTYKVFDWKDYKEIKKFLDKNLDVCCLESNNDTYNLLAVDDEYVFDLMRAFGIEYRKFDYSDIDDSF
jgi:hypothetical protein